MLGLLLSLNAFGAATLPVGVCPFREANVSQVFSPTLLHDFGEKTIREAFARRERWYGPCREAVSLSPHRFRLRYETAEIVVGFTFHGEKIEQYGFEEPSYANDTWEKFSEFLRAKWPQSSFYVSDAGKEHSFRGDELLDVGEGRTLTLAAAAEKAIESGRLSNGQSVKLLASDKALEMDDLASEPEGFPLTVAKLKERVFSRFDNTAADVLLRLVGREALEAGRPGTAPFLSRREFGWLMALSPPEMAKLTRETALATATSRNHAGEIPPLPAERYDHLGKIEWRASAHELCGAIQAVKEVPQVKNGLASRNFRQNHPRWKRAVYQAARDFGIAETTWVAQLRGRNKPTCISLILNETGFLDEEAAEEILTRLYGLLRAPGR